MAIICGEIVKMLSFAEDVSISNREHDDISDSSIFLIVIVQRRHSFMLGEYFSLILLELLSLPNAFPKIAKRHIATSF